MSERSTVLVAKTEEQKLALFQKALKKAEKNMMALSLLMDHFKQSGFDSSRYTPQFQEMMGQFAKLMRDFSRTEYEYEGPYNSDQTLERYKQSVSKSWKHKPEKAENADKPITEEEIRKSMQERADKMEALAAKRQQQALLEGATQNRPMITGPDGKQRYDFHADAESSDEDEADLVERVLGGDPNPGKHDTSKLKAAHLARLKSESAPISKRLEDMSFENKIPPKRDMKIVDALKLRGGDSYQEYALKELDDIHTMQKGFLAEIGSDDEEDGMSEAFRTKLAKNRGNKAVERTEEEMRRRKTVQEERDRQAVERKKL
jgi:hypothetical protein